MGEITGAVRWRTAWGTDNAESWYTKERPKEHQRLSTRGLKEGQRASWVQGLEEAASRERAAEPAAMLGPGRP